MLSDPSTPNTLKKRCKSPPPIEEEEMPAQEASPFGLQKVSSNAQDGSDTPEWAKYYKSPEFIVDLEGLCKIFPNMDMEIVEDGKTMCLTYLMQC